MLTGNRFVGALLSTTTAGFAVLAIRLLSIAVLSRLVPAESFGFYFMGQSVALLCSVAGNGSFSYRIMEASALSARELAVCLVIPAGLTLLLTAMIGVAAEAAAPHQLMALFGISGLAVVASAPAMSALRSAEALGRRRLEFRQLAWAEIWANVLGVLVLAPALGVLGFQAVALVAGHWAYVIVKLSLVLHHNGRNLPHRLPEGAPLPSSSGRFSAFGLEVLDLVTVHLLRLVIGAAFGQAVVALWSRASQLILLGVQLLLQPVAMVVVPLGLQDGKRRRHLTDDLPAALDSAVVLLLPVAISIFILSREITLLLLGRDWLASEAYLEAFSLLLLGRTVQRVFGILGRATQTSGRRLAIDAVALVGYGATLGWLLQFGPLAAAWVFSLWCCLAAAVHFALAEGRTGFSRVPGRFLGCLVMFALICTTYGLVDGSDASMQQKAAILLVVWTTYGLVLLARVRSQRQLFTSDPFFRLFRRINSEAIR